MGARLGFVQRPMMRKALFTLGGMAAFAGFPGCNSTSSKPSTLSTSSNKPIQAAPASAAPKVTLPELPLPKARIEQILAKSWEHYKKTLIAPDGRPLANPDTNDIDADGNRKEHVVFSEGAGYVLQRANGMKDQATFDKVWTWTQKNLQRKNIQQIFNPKTKAWEPMAPDKQDNLFAWQQISSVGGRDGGVLTLYHFDPATDADLDIAAALLLAHETWGSNGKVNYLKEAIPILNDIWNKETKVIAGRRVLLGSDTQIYTKNPFTGDPGNGFNPSYIRPGYFLSLFPKHDSLHNWAELAPTSYELVIKVADATMHGKQGQPVEGKVNLVPDWASLDNSFKIIDHAWSQGDHKDRNDYYWGGDAFRLPFWMVGQALKNPADTVARKYLTDKTGTKADYGPHAFLKRELDTKGTIYAGYQIDGTVLWPNETLQTLSVYMTYFWAAGDKASAKKLADKVMAQYDPSGFWKTKESEYYYGNNWVALNLMLMARGPEVFVGGAAQQALPTLPPISSAAPVEKPTATAGFELTFSGVNKGTQDSNDLPVVLHYNVTSAPAGTETLSLFFITNKEWEQGALAWTGPGKYSFEGHVWKGHLAKFGKPAGKKVTIKTAVKAIGSDGETVLGETRGGFTLNKVK